MPELELLPEKRKKLEFKTKRPFRFSILILVGVLAAYAGLIFYNRSLNQKINDLDAALLIIKEKRDLEKEKRVLEVKAKLTQAESLLTEHIFWSRGFKKIQNLTLASVKLENLVASVPESKFEFKGSAPNLTAIARQGANFLNDDSIKDISINQIKILLTGRTEFVIKLTFDPDKFLK